MSLSLQSFGMDPPSKFSSFGRMRKYSLLSQLKLSKNTIELSKELSKKYKVDVENILNLIITKSEIYVPVPLSSPVCEDPTDDKFLACALISKENFVISGDKALLATSGFQGIKVINPKNFLEIFIKNRQ